MKVLNLKTHPFNPATDVYIGRKNTRYGMHQSKWRNPYKVGRCVSFSARSSLAAC